MGFAQTMANYLKKAGKTSKSKSRLRIAEKKLKKIGLKENPSQILVNILIFKIEDVEHLPFILWSCVCLRFITLCWRKHGLNYMKIVTKHCNCKF